MNGAQDVFLTKVDLDGNLLFSTYLGGSSMDAVDVLTVDAEGNTVLAGRTRSADFPTTPNAYISEFQSSQSSPELYVAKIATGSATLEYSTGFATGGLSDLFRGVVEVSGGEVYLVLASSKTDFPVTDGSTNSGFGGLLARLSADGSTLVYASYAHEFINSLVLDANGDLVLVEGGDNITTIDPATNMVISKVPAHISGRVVLAENGNWVAISYSSSIQATSNGYPSSGSFGSYVAEVSGDGSPVFTSYMPIGTASFIASGPNGAIYVLGVYGLVSRIFPDQTDPLMALPRILGIANAAEPVTSKIAPGEIVSLYGPSIGSQEPMTTQIGGDGLVTTSLGGIEVHFNGTPGRMLYTGPLQINVAAPFAWSQGNTVLVEVFHDGDLWSSQTLYPVDAEPGVFRSPTLAQSAAALNQDQTINSQNNRAPAGTVVTIFLTGAGEMTGGAYQDGEVFDPSTPIANLPVPKLPVVVYIFEQVLATGMETTSKRNLEVLYAGQAPASLAGVIQVNFRLPVELPANPDLHQTVILSVGSARSISFSIWMTAAAGQ